MKNGWFLHFVCLLLQLLALIQVSTQNHFTDNHFISAMPPAVISSERIALESKLIEARTELIKLKRRQKKKELALKYAALADDIIKHAVNEKNETVKQKQLQLANEIIRDPIHTMESLKRKLTARRKAKKALDLAKAETDPILQSKLLEEAEDQVLLFKTGKKRTKNQDVEALPEEEVLTGEQAEGLFGEELDRFADKLAHALIIKANSVLDDAIRNKTLKTASEILANPKKNIKEYFRKRDIVAASQQLLFKMRKRIKSEADPSKKRELIRNLKVLGRDPVAFHDKLVQEEEQKIVIKSKERANRLASQAEAEPDIKKAEHLMKLAKLYLAYPLDYWANVTELNLKKKYLNDSPPNCRSYVQQVYSLGQDELDKTFTELTAPPRAPPISGIVNFAQTKTSSTAFTSKKAKLANDDFGFEKRYIKISFKGWMKKNSELHEKAPQKLLSKKVIPQDLKVLKKVS